MAPPVVLYVDQASVSGLAWSTDLCDADIHSTTLSVVRDYGPRRSQHRTERHILFRKAFGRRLDLTGPGFVGYELPPSKGSFINHNSLMHNFGYCCMIEIECEARGIPYAPINGHKFQAAALGKGALYTAAIEVARFDLLDLGYSHSYAKDNARKHALCLAARSRGWRVRDDNEADALFGLDHVCGLIRSGELKVDG